MPAVQDVASSESTQPTPTQPPAVQGEPDENAAGGKRQLLADLAKERDERQALAAQIESMKTGFAKALGIATDQPTPDQLLQQLEVARGETASMRTQLAVFHNTPTGVDVQALLDSQAFQRELAAKNPGTDTEIRQVITEYVTANPRFRTTPTGGAKDVNAGTQNHGNTTSMDA